MATPLPPLRLHKGLVTTPGEATPDNWVSCMNFVGKHGTLEKRSGMRFLHKAVGTGLGFTPVFGLGGFGFAAYPALPATIAATATATATDNTLYIGYSGSAPSSLMSIFVTGSCDLRESLSQYKNQNDLTFEYWNGTTWLPISVSDCFTPTFDITNKRVIYGPFLSRRNPGGVLGVQTGQMLGFSFRQPKDAANMIIGGVNSKLIRVSGFAFGNFAATDFVDGIASSQSCSFSITPSRVIKALYFIDRGGSPHEFYVYVRKQVVGGGALMTVGYVLDGTVLTQSTSLSFDFTGSIDYVPAATAFYHSATDRIIGSIDNTWFYAIPKNNGEIYSLSPDSSGVGTPYSNLGGGLRSALPYGGLATIHDGRIFTASGQNVQWSSPDVYADIWPNDNELVLGDSAGNVQSLASLGGVLLAFKRDSIWVLQSDGSADGYTAFQLSKSVGTVAPRSVAVAGVVAYFMAEDGIYRTDGQTTTKISSAIDGYLGTSTFSARASNAIGLWHTPTNQYRLFYSNSTTGPLPSVVQRSGGPELDAALYVDLTNPDEPSFWPQGALVSTDYGFGATEIVSDSTADLNRLVLIDDAQCFWEMDQGCMDGANAVKAAGVTHRYNLGSTAKSLVRFISPTQAADSAREWTLEVIAEGDTVNSQLVSFSSAGLNPADAFFVSGDVVTAGGVFANMKNEQTLLAESFQMLGRFFQMEFNVPKAVNGTYPAFPWSMDFIQFEVGKFGRRG